MIVKSDTMRLVSFLVSFKINRDAKFLGMRSNIGVMEIS